MSIAETVYATEYQPGLKDYVAALLRRRGRVALVSALVLLASLALAFGLPSVYRSSASILIEEQDIPSDLVRSTVTSFADQRIQVISQRVMTRANLTRIIDKYHLYSDLREKETMGEIIDQMRNDIQLNRISADVIDPRSGRPTQATIAFNISYDGKQPEVVQRVANELVSLYLTENIRNRTQKAEEATDFLAGDATRLGEKLASIEEDLAAFKEKNIGRLPELMDLNMTLLDRAERNLQAIKAEINSHEERIVYLQGQLSFVDPISINAVNSAAGGLDPDSRLKMLELKLVSLSARYGKEYPDLIKVRNEIKALQHELGVVPSSGTALKAELKRLRNQLVVTRERYSDEHPDVLHLRKSIDQLEEKLSAGSDARSESSPAINNPTYINLQSQLESTKLQLKALNTQWKDLKIKMSDYENRLQRTPQVEREYQNLTREHQNVLRSYQMAKAKQMEAQVAQELEKERKAERFTLIEPPELPEIPVKPNRKALIFLGLVLSLGAGLGYGLSLHALDGSVRGLGAVQRLLGEAPLAAIPYLRTDGERRRQKRYQARSLVALLIVVIAVLAMLHFFWKPLDVVWFVLLHRIGWT